jgi:hypothetical protein
MSNKKKIYDELSLLAATFGATPNVDRIKIYTEDLSEFDFDSVILAIRTARKTFKFFPQLAELIDLVKNPGAPTDEQAVMIANEIIECLSKFGAYQVKELKEHLGPEKYGIIERSGGWTNLSQITYAEIPTTRAQLREVAKAYLNRSVRENNGGPARIDTRPLQTQLQKANFGGLISESDRSTEK